MSHALGDKTSQTPLQDVELGPEVLDKKDYDDHSTRDENSIVSNSFTRKLLKYGVEEVGVQPIPVDQRTDKNAWKVSTLWAAMNIGIIPLSTGIIGTLEYGMSLRDTSLVILFFNIICALPVAYLSTLGPKTGLRQMIQARYSFGLVGAVLPVTLNILSEGGYCILNALLGSQTLAAVSGRNLSPAAGIVVVSVIALAVSFCGYRVLHMYEAFAWIPALVCLIIAVGCGGKHFSEQAPAEPATAPTVLSFGVIIAGYMWGYACMASDFFIYIDPTIPSTHIFAYTFFGLCIPTIPLMVVGAAMGASVPVVPSWTDGDTANSVGGVLVAMLEPAGGFGKFIAVLLALSVIGNVTATMYSITLNIQVLISPCRRIPRYVFAALATAVIIPVGIVAAENFYETLVNLLSIIGYWTAAYAGIAIVEHIVFRKSDPLSYDHAIWNKLRGLPTGLAAIGASLCAVGVIVPSMAQVWYTGPIGEKTGDIGFELAFVVAALTYIPFRTIEVRLRGRL